MRREVLTAAERASFARDREILRTTARLRKEIARLGRAVRVPLSEIERLIETGTTAARGDHGR